MKWAVRSAIPVAFALALEVGLFETPAFATPHFRGEINQKAVDAVIPLLRANGTLRITSSGGHSFAAMRLANAVRDLNITLEVHGLCASACASYVYLSARRVQNAPGAIIGGFKSGNGYAAVMGEQTPLSMQAWYREHLEEETAFFARLGIDLAFLRNEAFAMEPVCIRQSELDVQVGYTKPFVVPSAAVLTAFGLSVPEGWPASQDDLDRRFSSLGFNLGPSVRPILHGHSGLWSQRGGALPPC